MHFSATALIALSSLGLTSAAPFAGPEEDLYGRSTSYEIVNVGGESSSAAPELDTVTETVKSVVTTPGAVPVPVTVTVTATPSSIPFSSAAPSSTPHGFAPGGSSFFPPGSGFLRRGLNAAGDPYYIARSYSSSSSAAASSTWSPVPTPPLAARGDHGWYTVTVSSTPSSSSASMSTPLVARQFGGWNPSVPAFSSATPSSMSVPVSATPLVAREWPVSSSSVSVVPSMSWVKRQAAPSSSTPLVAREWPAPTSSSAAWSFTPTPTPTVLARRAIREQAWSSASSAPSSSYSLSSSATPLLY
ncbi:hypothetical protein N7448_006918 [Penicillium atrosanguineum]|uniref:Uncharacterized protein n=1 Tax=Penicillium atrosanguineum TaxID=1132637 RepID=A0A9W9PTZ6_9EURO|nr:hypothetical protein N7448_006918 [Penicillium atrosanguineum]KAJ5308249.1 hypothetical protein N7476_008905 [Penicillium atrosanguineum]